MSNSKRKWLAALNIVCLCLLFALCIFWQSIFSDNTPQRSQNNPDTSVRMLTPGAPYYVAGVNAEHINNFRTNKANLRTSIEHIRKAKP